MESLFKSFLKFLVEFIYSWSDIPFFGWVLISATGMALLRKVIFDFLVCSINCQKIGTGYKNARAIRKQQGAISRITFSYISGYLREEYRNSYRIYMVMHALYWIWLVLCTMWYISSIWITYENEVLFRSIICAVGVAVFAFLLFVPYNMVTHMTRRVERRFPSHHR